MASMGQFRFSPSGRVIGLGLDAALNLAQVRGYHGMAVSLLLQEAEAAILSVINLKTEAKIDEQAEDGHHRA